MKTFNPLKERESTQFVKEYGEEWDVTSEITGRTFHLPLTLDLKEGFYLQGARFSITGWHPSQANRVMRMNAATCVLDKKIPLSGFSGVYGDMGFIKFYNPISLPENPDFDICLVSTDQMNSVRAYWRLELVLTRQFVRLNTL